MLELRQHEALGSLQGLDPLDDSEHAHIVSELARLELLLLWQKVPLQGRSCHAAIGARIVPWRQPVVRAINLPIASTALLRPEPDALKTYDVALTM